MILRTLSRMFFCRSPLWPGLCLILGTVAAGSLTSCMSAYKKSLGEDINQTFTRMYLTDMNIAWQAVLDALKAVPIEVSNRDGGYLQTKWVENASSRSLTDFYGETDSFAKAQYRFKVTLVKGLYQGRSTIKISVQKDSIVQRDALEGWRPVETDTIEENTLLYRIGRIITIRTKLNRIEEDRIKHSLDQNKEF